MKTPSVAGLYIALDKSAPLTSLTSVEAITGEGLVGDRYYLGIGYYSGKPGWGAQVTLIQNEAIEAVNIGHHAQITAEMLRRNIVTKDVDILALIGKNFRCGNAILHGTKRFPPCQHLVDLCGMKEVLKYFAYGSGIGAEVIESGKISIEDRIEVIA